MSDKQSFATHDISSACSRLLNGERISHEETRAIVDLALQASRSAIEHITTAAEVTQICVDHEKQCDKQEPTHREKQAMEKARKEGEAAAHEVFGDFGKHLAPSSTGQSIHDKPPFEYVKDGATGATLRQHREQPGCTWPKCGCKTRCPSAPSAIAPNVRDAVPEDLLRWTSLADALGVTSDRAAHIYRTVRLSIFRDADERAALRSTDGGNVRG